jgi:hypothetical protein
MRALARDPDQRFRSASAQGSSRTSRTTTGCGSRRWWSPDGTLFRSAQGGRSAAQGAFFVEQHVVRTLIEAAPTADPTIRNTADPTNPRDQGAISRDEATDTARKHRGRRRVQTPLAAVPPPLRPRPLRFPCAIRPHRRRRPPPQRRSRRRSGGVGVPARCHMRPTPMPGAVPTVPRRAACRSARPVDGAARRPRVPTAIRATRRGNGARTRRPDAKKSKARR